ncbi:ATP-binding Cassette (ABC) Superfamily [Thraustotheca clavata]|uniref:ATP-binding Cassette (ABC) Superfamily n=1 Tax=Thraustotheca clavata TaxID=74557 RepID=A0A1V9YNL5_9STRA|nr:ATP-binding Cassette (ABC) Superfamily [Thraustotheca clavata]
MDSSNTEFFSKANWCDQCAVVLQDGGVLNDTILENIEYGRPGVSREDCLRAATLADCHSLVDTLKDGYDIVIGQHAVVNLSGGQIQVYQCWNH